jgi:hypothetical protein
MHHVHIDLLSAKLDFMYCLGRCNVAQEISVLHITVEARVQSQLILRVIYAG